MAELILLEHGGPPAARDHQPGPAGRSTAETRRRPAPVAAHRVGPPQARLRRGRDRQPTTRGHRVRRTTTSPTSAALSGRTATSRPRPDDLGARGRAASLLRPESANSGVTR
jgi:hypothetical protein